MVICPTNKTILIIEGLASGETFPIGTTTVTYQATDAAGNTDECSFSVSISEDAAPCAVAVQSTTVNGVGSVQACEGNTDSFLLEASATGNGTLSYQWQNLITEPSFSWQNIEGATNPTLTLSNLLAGNYNYRVVVISDNLTPDNLSDDCSAVSGVAVSILINPLPTVTFTAPADLAEDAGVQTALGGGTPTGGMYSGPGVIDDANGLTYSFDPAAAGVDTHTITYTFADANGCSRSASDDVEVFMVVRNMPPIVVGGDLVTVSVDENQTFVYDVDATDVEDDLAGLDLTYTISTVDGVDRDFFDIVSNTGVVTFIAAPDFENPQDFGGNNGYNIRVLITDSEGAQTQQNLSINVTDVDEIAPVIMLVGDNPLELNVGDTYEEFGATATDNASDDSNLSEDIIIDASLVDTSIAGNYEVSYNVSDFAGNPAIEVVRMVNVNAPSGMSDNDPDDSINLALLDEAILSGSVSNGRGTPDAILYDPLLQDYRMRTNWNEYGVNFGENLGRPDADNGFLWQVDISLPVEDHIV